jgi:hypothetical protein
MGSFPLLCLEQEALFTRLLRFGAFRQLNTTVLFDELPTPSRRISQKFLALQMVNELLLLYAFSYCRR